MNKKERMCHLWLNTFFVVNPVIHKITERELIEQEAKTDRQSGGSDPAETQQQNQVEARERTLSTGIMGKAYLTRPSSDEQPFDVIDLSPEDQSRNVQPPIGAESCITVEFPKAYLDRAVKDKEHFPASFSIRLYFSTRSDFMAATGPHTIQSMQHVARNGAPSGSTTISGNLKQHNHTPIATHNVSSGIGLSNRMPFANSDAGRQQQYALQSAPRNTSSRPALSASAAHTATQHPSLHASLEPSVQMQMQVSRHIGDMPQAPTAVHEPRSCLGNYPTLNSVKQNVARVGSNDTMAPSFATQHTHVDEPVRSPIARTNSGFYPAPSANRAQLQAGGNGHPSPTWVSHPAPQATAPGNVRYRQPSDLSEHQPNVRHGYSAPATSTATSMAGIASIKVNSNGGRSAGVSSPNRALPVASSRGSPSAFGGANISTPAPSTAFITKFPPTAQPEASDDDDDRTLDDTEDDTEDTDDDEEVDESRLLLNALKVDENSNTCAAKAPALPTAAGTTDAQELGDVPSQNYSVTSLV